MCGSFWRRWKVHAHASHHSNLDYEQLAREIIKQAGEIDAAARLLARTRRRRSSSSTAASPRPTSPPKRASTTVTTSPDTSRLRALCPVERDPADSEFDKPAVLVFGPADRLADRLHGAWVAASGSSGGLSMCALRRSVSAAGGTPSALAWDSISDRLGSVGCVLQGSPAKALQRCAVSGGARRTRASTSPGDRRTTAREICGEICPAVRKPC